MKNATDLILSGELSVVGRLVDASNATLLAQVLDTDPKVEVIYKPVAGERPLWDFPDGNLASREYSAYLLSDLAKFHLVPFTVLREGPFGFGMVQEWIKIDDLVDLTSKLTLKPSKIIFNPYINPNYSFIPICSQCSLDFENFKKNNNIEDNMEVEMKHSKSCLWADYFIIKIRNICNKVQIVRKIKRK